MASIQQPILEKDGALDDECDMCSKIVESFKTSFSISILVELGNVGDLLAQSCPHVDWLRHIGFMYGIVPDYETKQLQLHKFRDRRSAYFGVNYSTRAAHYWSTTRHFELLFRPEIPHHPGTAMVLDNDWIDISLIKDWSSRCMNSHSDSCDKSLESLAPFKPQYLIDVKRYCIDSCIDACPRFIALSYTWGQTKSFRTTMSTVEQLEKPGSLSLPHIASQIPKTILNAMELTRSLGENWLWVDSLCIVQDDEVALGHELKQMHRIYASSFLTIIAKDGRDADYGLRGLYGISTARSVKQSIIPLARNERLSLMQTEYPLPTPSIYDYTERMWTCQEQVFSTRCLTFESGYIAWQCSCANWVEQRLYDPEGDGCLTGDLNQFRDLIDSHVPTLWNLTRLVRHFNQRHLNFDEDVFDAFSGFHTHLNSLYPSGLVFGHPELFFDISLCWFTVPHSSSRRRKPARNSSSSLFRHRLPSWSWMGWHGGPVFPFDLEHTSSPSSEAGFTESVTEFHIIESPRTVISKKVDCTWSQLRKASPDYMPSGWKRIKFEPPKEFSGDLYTHHQYRTSFMPGSMPKELPRYIYSHTSGGDNPRNLCWYPVPVVDAASEEDTEHQAYREYQYLWCQTTQAYLFGSLETVSDGDYNFYLIKDSNGNAVGGLQSHYNEESGVLEEGVNIELIAIVKGWTTALRNLESRAHVMDEIVWMDQWQADIEKKQDCYHVLWMSEKIRWLIERVSGLF
ncbi:het-domain-containing protein [Fusarium flagelliforme]|uniref:Het-domain-containing protein n=1 Tax=Fusarium flagelliforme TaxID=2675880 RepID=A0A395MI67_9HYPO|nr:het-domain-containing protein [Fusarium flagelliforme]